MSSTSHVRLLALTARSTPTCFSDAAAGLYQPAGGHRHSLELAISVVKSEIASGEDLLPEHVPSTLMHELETVSASWQQNVSMAFDRFICKITGRENSLEIQRAAGFPALSRGRETQRAAGFPALRRSLKTRQIGGWASLRRGLETIKAAGLRRSIETRRAADFFELQRGRETRRIGWASLRRGRETQKATGFSALQRGRETSRIGGWASLRRGRKTQKATGFPALQRGRETQRANGRPGLRRAVGIRLRTILDEADKKYGFQRACSALPTLTELRCGHDDCQQPLPPDLDPRYTPTGEYLAKFICNHRKKIAHSGCSHRSAVAIPQDASIKYVWREYLPKEEEMASSNGIGRRIHSRKVLVLEYAIKQYRASRDAGMSVLDLISC